jgi:hypothetical protein
MLKKPSGAFYRHILAEAWGVVKRGRALWILGFFVSFLGNGGVYELLIQGTGRLGLQQDFGQGFALAGLMPSADRFAEALAAIGGWSAFIGLLIALTVLVLFAVAVWVVVSSQGGLIEGIRSVSRGRNPGFSTLFAAGNETFWPLLVLNLLSRLAVTLFFYLLLALMLLLLAKTSLFSSLAYLIGFLVFIPLTLIIGFITIYAANYVVLQRLPFVSAVESAIALFRKYWLISLETAVILFGINVLVAMAVGAALGLAGFVLLPFALGASLLQSRLALGLLLSVSVIVGVAALAAVGAGLAAFQHSVWTLLFTKLHVRGHGASSKLARWFDRLLG